MHYRKGNTGALEGPQGRGKMGGPQSEMRWWGILNLATKCKSSAWVHSVTLVDFIGMAAGQRVYLSMILKRRIYYNDWKKEGDLQGQHKCEQRPLEIWEYAEWENDDDNESYWLEIKGRSGPTKQYHVSFHAKQTSRPPDAER